MQVEQLGKNKNNQNEEQKQVNPEEQKEVDPKEIELFFGPSKEFSPIFKMALIKNFDLLNEPIFAQILANMVLG